MRLTVFSFLIFLALYGGITADVYSGIALVSYEHVFVTVWGLWLAVAIPLCVIEVHENRQRRDQARLEKLAKTQSDEALRLNND
jgi:hypothetical protein